MEIFYFLIRYWKFWTVCLLLVGMLGGGTYVGWQYKRLVNIKAESQIELEKKDIELKNALHDLSVKDNQIKILEKENGIANDNIKDYMKMVDKLQKSKNAIQDQYNKMLERINHVKLPLNEKGTLNEPYVLIDAGLPDEYTALKGRYNNSRNATGVHNREAGSPRGN